MLDFLETIDLKRRKIMKNKIFLRIVFDSGSIIMEYSDNQHLFQACKEFDENGICWEFV